MGLVILGIAAVYLLISIGVVISAAAYASKHGKSVKHWGWSAVLVMYLIPFWDWLPTIAIHQYYCAIQSGFWIYKTLDLWEKENPGVMENLTPENNSSFTRTGDKENHTDKNVLNQRFYWTSKKQHIRFLLPVYRWELSIIDGKSGEVLARRVYFSSGGGRDYRKFWMNNETCDISHSESIRFSELLNQFKGTVK